MIGVIVTEETGATLEIVVVTDATIETVMGGIRVIEVVIGENLEEMIEARQREVQRAWFV